MQCGKLHELLDQLPYQVVEAGATSMGIIRASAASSSVSKALLEVEMKFEVGDTTTTFMSLYHW